MFPSTHRSVLADLNAAEPHLRARAWDRFSEAYWQPVFRYLRLRWHRDTNTAEDITQDFFAQLVQRNLAARHDPRRGSFHNFLRHCLDNHVRSRLAAESAQKRRPEIGGHELVEVAGDQPNPEEIFLREWQRQIMNLALADFAALCQREGKAMQHALFTAYDLAAAQRPTYEDLAALYEVPVTQVTNYLAWARRELRRLALDRLAGLSVSESEFRSEASRLFAQ